MTARPLCLCVRVGGGDGGPLMVTTQPRARREGGVRGVEEEVQPCGGGAVPTTTSSTVAGPINGLIGGLACGRFLLALTVAASWCGVESPRRGRPHASVSGPLAATTFLCCFTGYPWRQDSFVRRDAVTDDDVQRIENTGQCELPIVVWAAPVMRESCLRGVASAVRG